MDIMLTSSTWLSSSSNGQLLARRESQTESLGAFGRGVFLCPEPRHRAHPAARLADPPTSKAAIEDWLGTKTKQAMQDFAYQWMIDTLEGETVGSIVTHTCDSRTGTFSYALDVARDFQRQGFATEAINLVLSYYFQELRFQKVTVSAASNNEASIALHKHLGFKHEGTQRRMVFSEGVYHDLEWFGFTVEEFSHSD